MREFTAGLAFVVSNYDQAVGQLRSLQSEILSFNAMTLEAGKFEAEMEGLRLTANATEKEMRKLKQAALEAGLTSGFAPREAAEGLKFLAQTGFTARQSLLSLQPVLDFATSSLGEVGIERSAFLASQSVKAFRIEVGELDRAFSEMLVATTLFGMSMEDLPLGMGIVARGASKMEQSLETSLIMFGMIKNVIPTLERSATATTVMMERMVNPRRRDELKKLFDIDILDEQGNFRDMLDVLNEILLVRNKFTKGEFEGHMFKIFGERGGGGAGHIIEQLTQGIETREGTILRGAEAIKYFREELGRVGSDGVTAIERFKDAMLNTWEGQQKVIEGVIATIKTALGEQMIVITKPILAFLRDSIQKIVGLYVKAPDIFRRVAAAILILGGAFVSAITFFVGTATAIAAVVTALTILGPIILKVTLGMMALSTLLLPIIGGLTVMQGLWSINFMGVQQFVGKAIVAFGALGEIIGNYRKGATRMSVATSNALTKTGWQDWVIMIGGHIGRIIEYVQNLIETISLLSPEIFVSISGAVKEFKLLIQDLFYLGRDVFEIVFGKVAIEKLDGSVESMEGFVGFVRGSLIPVLHQIDVDTRDAIASVRRFIADNAWEFKNSIIEAKQEISNLKKSYDEFLASDEGEVWSLENQITGEWIIQDMNAALDGVLRSVEKILVAFGFLSPEIDGSGKSVGILTTAFEVVLDYTYFFWRTMRLISSTIELMADLTVILIERIKELFNMSPGEGFMEGLNFIGEGLTGPGGMIIRSGLEAIGIAPENNSLSSKTRKDVFNKLGDFFGSGAFDLRSSGTDLIEPKINPRFDGKAHVYMKEDGSFYSPTNSKLGDLANSDFVNNPEVRLPRERLAFERQEKEMFGSEAEMNWQATRANPNFMPGSGAGGKELIAATTASSERIVAQLVSLNEMSRVQNALVERLVSQSESNRGGYAQEQ